MSSFLQKLDLSYEDFIASVQRKLKGDYTGEETQGRCFCLLKQIFGSFKYD